MLIEYNGKKYQFIHDDQVGSCARCVGTKDNEACGYLSPHCTGGYFIDKRGPGRPRKES